MGTDLVFDAEPLIAYLYDEPGSDRVEDLLVEVYDGTTSAAISEVTATEIAYKVAWLRADDRPDDDDLALGRRQVRNFRDQGVEQVPPTDSWPTAARVKAAGGISLGDSFAVALAVEQDARLVVGADDDFATIPVDVDCERVRSEPA